MALLSNINDKFAVDSTGAIQFNGQVGTSGYVLKSNANAAPTWVDPSTVIGGPYLPLTGGTLTGATATASGISFTVGGVLTGASATFVRDTSGYALRLDSPNATTDNDLRFAKGGTDYAAIQVDATTASNFQFYVNDGTNWINTLNFARADGQATFTGNVQVTGAFKDSSGDAGTSGQILSSTATGTNWIDNDTGDISGSGVAGEVAYFTGTKTIANNAGMSFSNQQIQFDGIGGADGYILPYDQNPGYSNMAAGGFGLLFRESYDSYVTNNTYYYKTGGTSQWRAKYTTKGASVLSMLDGKFNFDTAPANTTSPYNLSLSTRMTILEGGNVGIGTTSPSYKLAVNGDLRVEGNSSGTSASFGGNGDFAIDAPGVGGGRFVVKHSTGNVGIGTTSPGQKLEVYQAATNSQAYVTVQNNRSRNAAVLTQTTNGGFYTGTSIGTDTLCWQVYDASAGERMRIDSSGNLGVFGNTNPSCPIDFGTTVANDKRIIGTYVTGNLFTGIGMSSTTAGIRIAGDLSANNLLDIGYYSTDGNYTWSSTMFIANTNVGIGTISPFSRLQSGGHTFSGGNGMHADSRVGISNHGSLTGMMLASTYNDATYPEYGLVFVQGPNTSNYNVWSISPDGPAKGDSLNFIYGSNATNIHVTSPKVVFDGNGNVGIGTTSPANKLTVNGDIGYTGVIGQGSIYGNTGNNSYATMQLYNPATGYSTFNNQSYGYYLQTGGGTKLTILNNGNVGIGATSPAEKLMVIGDVGLGDGTYNGGVYANSSSTAVDSNWGLEIQKTSGLTDWNTRLKYYPNSGNSRKAGIFDSRNNRFSLYSDTNNTPNIIIAYGFLGINNTSPDAYLRVDGTTTVTAARFYGTGGTKPPLELRQNNTAGWFAKFYSDNFGTYIGGISFYGSSTTFNTSSDYRLKENIIPISDSITRLKQLKPSRFNFKQYPEITIDGFLAHEVQDIVPEAVTGNKDELDLNGKPVYQAIDHSRLVPLLVAAIQELEARVKELENK